MPEITFEQSIWYLPLCLLLAAGISYLVYTKKAPWDKWTNYFLTGFRFVLIFILLILLLNPLLNQIINDIEQPSFVIAIDNSTSMIQGLDSIGQKEILSNAKAIQEKLEAKNYEVSIHTLEGKIPNMDQIAFDQKTTNLDNWLRDIQSNYEGRNLGGVYLISDGKFNQGTSPAYFPYNYPVYALGVGDTLQKQDLVIQNVLFNKIAYQGNKFPVVAEIVNHGFAGQQAHLEIRNQGKVVASQNVKFVGSEGLTKIDLEVEAEENGMQQLDLRLKVLEGESVSSNNFRRIFVDVVDGKQKILLVAPTPHPDIKALAAVIDKNQNYELVVYIPEVTEYVADKYDLVISHQAYSRYIKTNEVVQEQRAKGVPVFQIYGERSNILIASRSEDLFTFSQKGAKRDMVFGSLNNDFELFSLSDEASDQLSTYPPVSVPYGESITPANAKVILYQRVGSIQTDKPLLYVIEQNEQKSAYLLAEGIWKWRMQEYATTDETKTFDDLFLKTIQFLSTKVDKRKFKFYPEKSTYFENQTVKFHAEIYNEIYERVYGESVEVVVTNASGFKKEFNFTPSSAYSKLEASNFEPGIYDYQAKVTLNGKQETVYGKFSVKELQLEELDQVADFNLLRQLAHNTEGAFYSNSQESLTDIDNFQLKGIIHSQEDIFPIIHLKWILYLLLTLVSIEWFTRKYNGGY